MPTRKELRRRALTAKHLFPWVSVNWTSLSKEQARQKERASRLRQNVNSSTFSILKNICTLYGNAPNTYCTICDTVHRAPKEISLFDHINSDDEDDNNGSYLNKTATLHKMNRKRYKNIIKQELKTQAIGRMQQAANALKARRRMREKKMQVPKDSFLQDFSDTGGSTVTKDMNDAIDQSFANQHLSRKDSRFKARMKHKGKLLKFPSIAYSNDMWSEQNEMARVAKKDKKALYIKKKRNREKAAKDFRRKSKSSADRRRRKKSGSSSSSREDRRRKRTATLATSVQIIKKQN